MSYDWRTSDPFPENEVECSCGAYFRSHSRFTIEAGIVSRKTCPVCDRGKGHRASRSDVETMTIGDVPRIKDGRRKPCPDTCDCLCHDTGGGVHDHPGLPCPGKKR